jgi:hypothetical protein
MAQGEKYFIGPGLREKLREVVGKVDALSVGTRGLTPRTAHQEMPRGASAGIKTGTFTGAWATATYKVVTIAGGTNTASVFNVCNPVADSPCAREVIFSKSSGTNVALEIKYQATCTTCVQSIGTLNISDVQHFDVTAIQFLGHDENGCLMWYSATTCT